MVRQLERQYLSDRNAFLAFALSRDAKDATPPSWEERQEQLDRWLNEGSVSEEEQLFRSLGLVV